MSGPEVKTAGCTESVWTDQWKFVRSVESRFAFVAAQFFYNLRCKIVVLTLAVLREVLAVRRLRFKTAVHI